MYFQHDIFSGSTEYSHHHLAFLGNTLTGESQGWVVESDLGFRFYRNEVQMPPKVDENSWLAIM